MLRHADLVSAVRLPNNLFTENANTEVGSDLIILQKNTAKQELTEADSLFINVEDMDGIGTSAYFVAHGGLTRIFPWQHDRWGQAATGENRCARI
jgi:predicted 3-demethylubiquinone-9 3-methyltransferase (glyoxalase superfamily)